VTDQANPYLAWNGQDWIGYDGSAWVVVEPKPQWDGENWLFWDGSQFRAVQPQPSGGPYARAAVAAPVTPMYYDEDPLAQRADAEATLVSTRLASYPAAPAITIVPTAATIASEPVAPVPDLPPPPDEFARVPDDTAPPPPAGSEAQVAAASLAPAAMTLGVLGILAALVPFVFFIAITLGVIGLVLALMARGRLRKTKQRSQTLVTAAVLASVIAIVGGLVGAYLVFFVISSNDQPVSNPQVSSSPIPGAGSSPGAGSTAQPTQPAG
jgi:hypothetical protein